MVFKESIKINFQIIEYYNHLFIINNKRALNKDVMGVGRFQIDDQD